MSDKKVCEVCGREKWAYSGPARNPDNCMIEFKWCPPADAAKHWKLGYEREKAKAAILTPEVLRLIEAGRKYGESIRAFNALPFDTQGTPGRAVYQRTTELAAALLIAARALPFEKPAESNHTEKQQLPKKGGE